MTNPEYPEYPEDLGDINQLARRLWCLLDRHSYAVRCGAGDMDLLSRRCIGALKHMIGHYESKTGPLEVIERYPVKADGTQVVEVLVPPADSELQQETPNG